MGDDADAGADDDEVKGETMRLFSDVDNGGERFDLVRMKQVSEREYVSREMALDAEEPQMEGSLYSDEKWESECVGQVWADEQATRDERLGSAMRKALAVGAGHTPTRLRHWVNVWDVDGDGTEGFALILAIAKALDAEAVADAKLEAAFDSDGELEIAQEWQDDRGDQ
jgi:hypothetical protein